MGLPSDRAANGRQDPAHRTLKAAEAGGACKKRSFGNAAGRCTYRAGSCVAALRPDKEQPRKRRAHVSEQRWRPLRPAHRGCVPPEKDISVRSAEMLGNPAKPYSQPQSSDACTPSHRRAAATFRLDRRTSIELDERDAAGTDSLPQRPVLHDALEMLATSIKAR